MKNTTEQNYEWAENYFNKKDYVMARACFEKLLSSPKYEEIATIRLIDINIKECRYSEAREMLDKVKSSKNFQIIELRAMLENIEFNFETSKKLYRESMNNSSNTKDTLLKLAKLDIEMGDYKSAEKTLSILQFDKALSAHALFMYIISDVIQGKYEEAYKRLLSVKSERINNELLKRYFNYFNNLLQYKLNKINKPLEVKNNYLISRIFDDSDEMLIKQIRNRTSKNNCFAEDFVVDAEVLKQYIDEIRTKGADTNFNIFKFVESRVIEMEKPVGRKSGVETSYLRASTLIGTNNIVTFHPINVSSEFNKEGFLNNKQLLMKRRG